MKNRIDRILIIPENGDHFESQFRNCLAQIDKYTEWTGSQILQLSFFIRAFDNSTYLERHAFITGELVSSAAGPSLSIIAQPPASGQELSVEVVLITNPDVDMRIRYAEEKGIRYTILSSVAKKEIYVGGISPVKPSDPFLEQVERAYKLLENILQREGMFFSDIARQWNYVEQILSIHDIGEEHMQNYQVLNDVRSRYYSQSNFENGYPAATGIGMNAGGIILEVYAVQPHGDMQIIPIKNPKQVDAYHYSESVLIGDALEHNKKKTTPKFERAKFVGIEGRGSVFISGTASIQNEKTVGIDDVEQQTVVTIENISNLIDRQHLQKLGINHKPDAVKYDFIRVYVKEKEYWDVVRKVCDDYYADIPVHYLIADVCRDNLLLEIEGVATIS